METDHENKLTEEAYWSNRYKEYKLPRIINIKIYINYRFDKFFKVVLKDKHKYKEKKFLEIGCGASAWLVYFSKEFNYDVTGIDYSEIGCKLALENMRLNSIDGKIINEDIFNINSDVVGKQDVVFSYGVIEHFDNPSNILQKMHSLLKEDGIVIVIVPNIKGVYGMISKYLHREVYQKHKVISATDMKALLKKSEFKNVKSTYFGTFNLGVIGWTNQPQLPKLLMHFLLPVISILNILSSHLLKKFKIEIESEFFSPYVIGIGSKT